MCCYRVLIRNFIRYLQNRSYSRKINQTAGFSGVAMIGEAAWVSELCIMHIRINNSIKQTFENIGQIHLIEVSNFSKVFSVSHDVEDYGVWFLVQSVGYRILLNLIFSWWIPRLSLTFCLTKYLIVVKLSTKSELLVVLYFRVSRVLRVILITKALSIET